MTKTDQSPTKDIILHVNGAIEFKAIGFFQPQADITPEEVARICEVFSAISLAAAAGSMSYMIDTLWDRINDAPELRRHFTPREPQP